MEADSTAEAEAQRRAVIVRWGGHPELVARGFVPVVRVFLWFASQLQPKGLSPVECVFVLQLMSFKWDESAPYPSLALLARRMGISAVYAKKVAAQLEEKGLLTKRRRDTRGEKFSTNEYDLQPLFDRLALHVRLHGNQGA